MTFGTRRAQPRLLVPNVSGGAAFGGPKVEAPNDVTTQ